MSLSDDAIFSGALEQPTLQGQESFVRTICEGNPVRCQRILKLLNAHRDLDADNGSGFILDNPHDAFESLLQVGDLAVGSEIGPFRVLGKLGEGGMGVVYAAEQVTPIHRKVALKLLKPGMDSHRLLARFEIERQVLEQMRHPGITGVLDAGVQENGRPYFAMELVEDAQSITQYCNSQKLSLQDRMRLMTEVAQIVQHAHQRGVIHRDLKPSNILITMMDDRPAPKVIDFGIAKMLSGTQGHHKDATIAGERFGTPAYMAPEQALGGVDGIDVRADVYSLGAILHELFCGSPPIRSTNSSHSWTAENYWESDFPRLSDDLSEEVAKQRSTTVQSLSQDLHGEPGWIIRKALSKDRETRYQSVADFQRDIEYFLANKPIMAAKPTLMYRAGKFVKRNRGLSAISAFALLTIVVAATISTCFALRAIRAERDAKRRLEQTLKAQKELVEQRDLAEVALRDSKALSRTSRLLWISELAAADYLQHYFQVRVEDPDATPYPIESNILVEPDERLVLKGNWEWVTRTFRRYEVLESNLENNQTTGELHQEGRFGDSLEMEDLPGRLGADQASINELEGQLLFQELLLRHIRQSFTNDDVFIAEILNNCALKSIDLKNYKKAQEYLQESIQIWKRHDNRQAYVIQAQLFLADCLRRDQRPEEAAKVLSNAVSELDQMDPSDEVTIGLRALASEVTH
ncbi:serine/threonine-protein kinase [Blastopirellula retiformator]|uniref:Serine/threonine-protein kinase Pkn1 n=1 Tax=Blastopirellula retiformator TaxID=2527970 RepID=A0A5C5V0X3_9BACT|nr:serine/threonine-protein kinase [Blastopirellula retiformator]TWT31570.1 Serine/threonine-protein kinase Pkn1 [Blastopirellula retiformator]